MKLHKGDQVIVTVGKDKGRKGKIDTVFPKESRVLISGINMYKRHTKKRDDKHPGGILDIARPIAVSKVALVCPKCSQPTRVGYLVGQNDKVRICRKCEQKI